MGASFHLVPVRGQTGSIRWNYRIAAQLGPWTLTPDRGTPDLPQPLRRILRAQVLDVDLLTLRQPGLRLVVPRPRGALTWQVLQVALDADGSALTALLGPYERQV